MADVAREVEQPVLRTDARRLKNLGASIASARAASVIRTPSAAIIHGMKSVWTNVPIAGDAVPISRALRMDVLQRKVLDVPTAPAKTAHVS